MNASKGSIRYQTTWANLQQPGQPSRMEALERSSKANVPSYSWAARPASIELVHSHDIKRPRNVWSRTAIAILQVEAAIHKCSKKSAKGVVVLLCFYDTCHLACLLALLAPGLALQPSISVICLHVVLQPKVSANYQRPSGTPKRFGGHMGTSKCFSKDKRSSRWTDSARCLQRAPIWAAVPDCTRAGNAL